ncbi:TAXI family TRAP transporter solute-binding subunit [Reyranella aquatilis]|uniref:TAXI family TRAP transporter solute-binding subunit n=1 Tax=Reyranella aquatilis TaxID=2035356 RepID=A0ABS8KVU6_9HYPH|nr:TAXI family TRAP transporter solute-binding subunit [Reyranella aquatilis]MCC8430206.1 TAXI family TRAP transporter solute-binding subunit [Reyranella aquatilis]
MIGLRRALLAAALVVMSPLAAPALAIAQPQDLTLGTASVGGTYHVYGGVVAALLTDKAGLQVTTQQTQGPNQNVIMIDDGKIGLGMTTLGVALQALQGSAPWTKGRKYESIRALFPMYDTPMQCVSLKKSGITSFRQLDGKTVGTGPKAGTSGTYFPLIFDALGMKVTARNGQSAEAGNQLNDGLIDAFCFGAGAPVPIFTQLDAEQQVNFFAWTPEEIAVIRRKMPEFTESTIPKGLYKQQTADQRSVGLYNFAIASKEMPDALAYTITRTILENNPTMLRGHAAARDTVAANASRNTILTFHPGAVRYYREKGIKLDPATLPK